MTINKQKIILVAVLVVGIGSLWFSGLLKGKDRDLAEISSPSPEPSVFNPSPEEVNKYPPAECNLTGKITFLSPGVFENKNANIIYKNIDSMARLIFWTVTPNDELLVGPNMFASLPLPAGTEDITVGLPKNPKYKSYSLTARVNYGRFIDGNYDIKEAPCSGSIPVEFNY